MYVCMCELVYECLRVARHMWVQFLPGTLLKPQKYHKDCVELQGSEFVLSFQGPGPTNPVQIVEFGAGVLLYTLNFTLNMNR